MMQRVPRVFAGARCWSVRAAVRPQLVVEPQRPDRVRAYPSARRRPTVTVVPVNERVPRARSLPLCAAAQKSCRFYSTDNERDSKTESRPRIIVVGIPNPFSWIRNKVLIFLVKLYFDINIASADFSRGAKQALVQVSTLISQGRFGDLQGLASTEAVEGARTKYDALTEEQRRNLAVLLDDIIFLIPENVSLLYDNTDVPEDPESTVVFKRTDKGGGSAAKKIVTAVYEFQMELTDGLDREWIVTNIWHWKQLE
ncbi:m-AAA protease-interacting protein 1, mitochondrial isoform X2 [Scleropages formosus]|uniref:m-AAA protease-interacting protein 1, mitochondrial isoform X2 n=1 Tax=Scleropages formosus TaxID=113540 RepID=UPI0010FAB1D4|nr:m-AAA protease-interacting protein 1, mitochondrial isoform X2 [Scleropages formosus]